MPERLTPGVYVEVISGGIRPIEGVATSTAGFIGVAARGIPDRATFVTGVGDYERLFGGHVAGEAGLLAQSVEAFFAAGGRRAYVVRVLPDDAVEGVSPDVPARTEDPWGEQRPVLRFTAKGKGIWSRSLRLHVEPSTSFTDVAFQLRVESVEGGRARTLERFDNVRMDPASEDYVVDVVNEQSQYLRAEDLFATGFLDVAADDRALPPIPAEAARLSSRSDDGFALPVGTELEFRWTSPGAPPRTGTVELTREAIDEATGQQGTGDEATLTAGQVHGLLTGQLAGEDFRVLRAGGNPAELVTAEGPWDASAADSARVRIDGAAPRTIDLPVAEPAEVTISGAPFDLSTGPVQITVDGTPQSHLPVEPADAADVSAVTGEELLALLNARFTDISAVADGNDVVLRTDRRGQGAALTVPAALGGGSATGSGIVGDPAALTAAEMAAAFNAVPGPFTATVDGDRVRFVQTDLDAEHRIQWAGSPAIVADPTEKVGPAVPADAAVLVEPAVATRAFAVVAAADRDTFEVANPTTITLSVGDRAVAVDLAAGDVTVEQVAGLLRDAVVTAALPVPVRVDAAGRHLVVSCGPVAAGVELDLRAAGVAPWVERQVRPGRPGVLVETQSALTVTVTETPRPGRPRAVARLFPTVQGVGLDENGRANPILRPALTEDTPIRLDGGTDGTRQVTASDFAGGVTADGERTGLRAFDVADIALLSIPGRNSPEYLALGIGYADANDVFFLADGMGSVDRRFQASADDVRRFVEGLPARSNNAAMFYPWLEVIDPAGVGRAPRRFVPPSGHMAGVFARTDQTRGVWKAPAGIEAVVPGALDLQHQLIDAEQELLHPIGLNCIRQFPRVGIVSWGARTLATDPEWRYVPVRRTALFIKESLRRGLQWAVFEPNDPELWDRIRGNISAFMLGLFRQGAFQGPTPEEAFAVQCDRETNPQELVDQGIVTAKVAFAPVKPAEFVVVTISQKALVA